MSVYPVPLDTATDTNFYKSVAEAAGDTWESYDYKSDRQLDEMVAAFDFGRPITAQTQKILRAVLIFVDHVLVDARGELIDADEAFGNTFRDIAAACERREGEW